MNHNPADPRYRDIHPFLITAEERRIVLRHYSNGVHDGWTDEEYDRRKINIAEVIAYVIAAVADRVWISPQVVANELNAHPEIDSCAFNAAENIVAVREAKPNAHHLPYDPAHEHRLEGMVTAAVYVAANAI